MNNDSKNIVDEIKRKRKMLGISQTELADRCGMPQSTIGRIENYSMNPSLDVITSIMNELDVSFEFSKKKYMRIQREEYMINGIVKDKHNNAIQNATIELKNEHFETILKTNTNQDGLFSIKSTNECKYLIAIKDYKINYLEYWATNINFLDDINLDIIIDKLEIYGLNAFAVNGAYDSIFLYFRPMSLVKFLRNESNICPSIKNIEIKIDDVSTSLFGINKVKEFIGNEYMNAYLVQVKKDVGKTIIWNKIDVKVIDDDNNVGMASLYNI